MIYVYPAVFTPCKEGGYAIQFPDLPGTNSQGEDVADAVTMARDALGSWLDCLMDEGADIPAASPPENKELEAGQFIAMVDIDMTVYRRKKDTRAIKKTLSIPCWLNERAEQEGINFSKVLQDGLISQLGLQDTPFVKHSPQ